MALHQSSGFATSARPGAFESAVGLRDFGPSAIGTAALRRAAVLQLRLRPGLKPESVSSRT